MNYLKTLILSLIEAVAYRFRGGGYIATGSDTLVRFVWAFSLSLSALAITHAWASLTIIITGFLSMVLVPHGFAMDAGENVDPPQIGKPSIWKRWPAAWLPQWTVEGWRAAPSWQKQAYDALQMFLVGVFRGILVFAPLAATNACAVTIDPFSFVYSGIDWLAIINGTLMGAVLQSFAYQAGVHWMPQKLGTWIADGWWPEFLVGPAWVLALEAFHAV